MAGLTKNINKFKQWTTEKIGGAGKTEVSEEFKRVQQEVETRHEHIQSLYQAIDRYCSTLEPKRLVAMDGRQLSNTKTVPLEVFGNGLLVQGSMCQIPGLTQYYIKAGEAQTRIAARQSIFLQEIKERYLSDLEAYLNEFKDYNALKKKLENRRLDFDAKFNRIQKAKRENPELGDQMRQAQLKYEETLEDTMNKMQDIKLREGRHMQHIRSFILCQAAYLRDCSAELETISSAFEEYEEPPDMEDTLRQLAGGGGGPPATRAAPAKPGTNGSSFHAVGRSSTLQRNTGPTRTNSQSSLQSRSTSHSELGANAHPLPGMVPRGTPLVGASTVSSPLLSSQSSFQNVPVNEENFPSQNVSKLNRRPSGSSISRSSTMSNVNDGRRRFLVEYDFEAAQDVEMSIRKGEVVALVEEIDEGWWIGEINDARTGQTRTGMFPANYVKPIPEKSRPPPPVPPSSNKPGLSRSPSSPSLQSFSPANTPPVPTAGKKPPIPRSGSGKVADRLAMFEKR